MMVIVHDYHMHTMAQIIIYDGNIEYHQAIKVHIPWQKGNVHLHIYGQHRRYLHQR